ncbi:von Willebrand factor type D domain protein [Ancylostoma ceylanicum]|uniref:von Willebrand factor type D domain protein n=1 Tax=Ancylostoma ceylanicum TaxID=53326 RepID=A0A0D6M5G5_9BILA|nr:von Willebrand factor type D domain protein [Ancylostoma ceylanicum]
MITISIKAVATDQRHFTMRFALLALVGVALGVHHTLDQVLLKPRTEYIFRFEGDVHSGIPLPSETEISRIEAFVHVQTPDDHNAVLKLRDVRFATGKDERKDTFKDIEELKLHTIMKKHIELLELPVRFGYKHGMVSELYFHNNDETWSMNVKRSIINMLQLNLHKMGRTDETKLERYENIRDVDNDYFTANERTIEGDCEVAYTIIKKKEDVTEVTKSVNFNKCTRRPITKYNFRYLTECRDCKETDYFEPSTVYTYLLEKEGLKKVEVNSVYTITLENQPVMKTEVRARIVLEETQEIRREFEWSHDKKETLIYSNEVEREIERFYMEGDDVEVLPYRHIKDKVEQIRIIVDELKELKENKQETTHLLSRLVSMFRMCTLEELTMVHNKIYKHVDVRIQKLIEHCLSIAGTRNTITHLLKHMKEMHHMHTYRIVHLLKSIQETPYPSPKIVDELVRFAETEIVRRSPVIRQTIWLTIGSVMRGVVGFTKDETLVREERRELKNRYLHIIKKEYEQAETIYEKKIILNKREELPVRMEAIDALRLLRESMPRKIQSILMPVYQNRLEQPELRMAALVRIMHTLPHQPVVVQIISTMEREPNQHVAAFTYDLLKSFVHTTHACYKKLALEIRPLLEMTRYVRPERMLTSTYKYMPMFTEEMLTGINMDFATIFGKNSVWPKEIMMSLDTVFNGMWNKYFFQLGLSQQNIEKLFEKITDKLWRMERETHTVVRGRRIRESMNILKEIARKLNIRPRVTDHKTPHVMLYLRYKDMDYAVLPINERIVDELVEKYITEGRIERRELELLFNRDPEFQLHTFTFLYEVIRKVPTTLGLPLITKCKLPTVMSAEGELTLEKITDGLRVRMNTHPSLVSTQVSEMRLWNPLFEQGVKIVRSVETRLPLDFVLEVLYNREIEFKYTMNIPTEEKTLMRVMSRPVVFFRFLSGEKNYFRETMQRTIMMPRWERLHEEKDKVFVFAGIKTVLRGNWIKNWNMRNFLLGEYDWEFVMIPTREAPRKIRFILNTGRIEKLRMERPDFTHLFEKEFETEVNDYERLEENTRRETFHRRIRDIERSEGYRHRMFLKMETVESPVHYHGDVEFVTVCDEELRYCKLMVEGKRSPMLEERREWRFNTKIQLVLPYMPKTLKELKEQIHREIQGLVEMRWGAEEMNELKMKIQLEQDKEQKRWLRLVEKEHKGLTAYDLLLRASRLNQLKTVVKYELTPFYKNLFERIYNFVRGYTFWHYKVTRVNNEHNRIFLKMNVDPVTRTLLNVLLETPYERMELRDFVVPQLYLPSIAKRTLRDIRDEMVKERVCEVKSTKVRTFDDVIFRAPLTNCYSVIAKDCSEEPRFAVLVKKIRKDSDEKMLKIINEREHVIEIQMLDEKLKVMVDKEKITKEELEKYKYGLARTIARLQIALAMLNSSIAFSIELMEDNMVRVRLEDLEVRFDGYTVKVYMGKHMIERQCGLCGHFDEEKDNEFLTPKKEYTDDLMEFHKSYLLNDECEVEKEFINEKKHYKVEEDYERKEDFVDIFEEDTRKERMEKDEEILEKTHVMEFSHRVCFSLEPVRVCRKNEEMDEVIDKKVRFTCLPRNSHEARQLLHKVHNKVLNLHGYPVSFVETIQVPRTCVVY